MKITFVAQNRQKMNFFFVYMCVICERNQVFGALGAVFRRFLGWKLLDCWA